MTQTADRRCDHVLNLGDYPKQCPKCMVIVLDGNNFLGGDRRKPIMTTLHTRSEVYEAYNKGFSTTKTTKYGIACHGGPKKRCLVIGKTRYPEELCGSAYYQPKENVFILAPIYPYESRKSALADMKKARERRCSMFLPYDGYGKCEIERDHA